MCMANVVLVGPAPLHFVTYCKNNGLRRCPKSADLKDFQLGCSGRLRSTFIVCSDDIKCHFWNEITYWAACGVWVRAPKRKRGLQRLRCALARAAPIMHDFYPEKIAGHHRDGWGTLL